MAIAESAPVFPKQKKTVLKIARFNDALCTFVLYYTHINL